MLIHHISHIKGNVLCDPVVNIALSHTYKTGQNCHAERSRNVYDKKFHAAADKPLINDFTRQDRRQKICDRRERNAQKHQNKLLPIWFQIRKNSFNQSGCYFGDCSQLLVAHIVAAGTPSSSSCRWHNYSSFNILLMVLSTLFLSVLHLGSISSFLGPSPVTLCITIHSGILRISETTSLQYSSILII